MMRQLITALVIALLAVIFALQNAEAVDVNFLVWEISNTSLALILVITLFIGFITGILMRFPAVMKRNKEIASLKRRVEELEKPGEDQLKF